MRIKFHKSGIQKYKETLNISIRLLLLFCLAVFHFGCAQNHISPQTETQALQIINDALNSDNPIIRINAIEIAATTEQQNFMPRIGQLLQDPYVPVRYASALAVGDMQYTPAANTVNQLLRDNDPNVLLAASYAMVKLGHPEYIQILRDSVRNNPIQKIKANAALLLGKAGDRDSIQLLHWLMTDPASSDMVGTSYIGVGYQAAEALAMLGDVTIIEKLWAMLYNTYGDIQIAGIRSMGFLGTKDAESSIVPLLEHEIPEIRLVAAEQLGKMNNQIGQSVVLDIIKGKIDYNPDLQSRERINILIALAIGEIRTPNLTKFLPELMKNESPFVRLAAAKSVIQCSPRL